MEFTTNLWTVEIFEQLRKSAQAINFFEAEDGYTHWTGFIPTEELYADQVANNYFNFTVQIMENEPDIVRISTITDSEIIAELKRILS